MPWGYVAAAGIGLYGASRGADAAESAAETSADAQREALAYQREVEALPLEIRNQFLPMLADFYGGGEGQQALIEDVQSSPFYEQMIQSGQEGVLSRAGPMGLTRSGNTARDLSQSNQDVLQRLVQQRLGGIAGLAQQPLNTQSIASTMSGIGQTLGQGQIGSANAMQQGYGGLFQTIMAGINNNWGQTTPPPTGP